MSVIELRTEIPELRIERAARDLLRALHDARFEIDLTRTINRQMLLLPSIRDDRRADAIELRLAQQDRLIETIDAAIAKAEGRAE